MLPMVIVCFFSDPSTNYVSLRKKNDPFVSENYNESKYQKFSNIEKIGKKYYERDNYGINQEITEEEYPELKDIFISLISDHIVRNEINSQYIKGIKIKKEFFHCPLCKSEYILNNKDEYRYYSWSCKCKANFIVNFRTLYAKLNNKQKAMKKVNKF